MKFSASHTAMAAANRSLPGRQSKIANRDGEINATSYSDLMKIHAELAAQARAGAFDNEAAEVAMTGAERQEALKAAYLDTNPQAWKELASGIASEVTDALARVGFMRRYLQRAEVSQGSIVRHRVRQRFSTAVLATGPGQVQTQYMRDKYVLAPEFRIEGRFAVEDQEVHQGSGDVLQDRYNEALEHVMVQEDRVLIKQFDTAASLVNNVQLFSGSITPATFSALQQEIVLWSLPCTGYLMSHDLMPDLQGAGVWGTYLDPVSKLEVLLTGRIANLFGCELSTDGFRSDRLKVVQPGIVYAMTNPEMIGSYSDRGPLQSYPLGPEILGTAARGWFLTETISQSVMNPRGVSRAARIA